MILRKAVDSITQRIETALDIKGVSTNVTFWCDCTCQSPPTIMGQRNPNCKRNTKTNEQNESFLFPTNYEWSILCGDLRKTLSRNSKNAWTSLAVSTRQWTSSVRAETNPKRKKIQIRFKEAIPRYNLDQSANPQQSQERNRSKKNQHSCLDIIIKDQLIKNYLFHSHDS
ncbi:hypothetical protein Glove_136g36 [Diversispora epigaea]|uniref:Uncharacterized protein n=1 Tax=Diversispora epigaea TaxID=1348612 RepID=A0A397J306_9GLOM|nr:hypothetical protein Glove_136g36 [Diversispora epigaea]